MMISPDRFAAMNRACLLVCALTLLSAAQPHPRYTIAFKSFAPNNSDGRSRSCRARADRRTSGFSISREDDQVAAR